MKTLSSSARVILTGKLYFFVILNAAYGQLTKPGSSSGGRLNPGELKTWDRVLTLHCVAHCIQLVDLARPPGPPTPRCNITEERWRTMLTPPCVPCPTGRAGSSVAGVLKPSEASHKAVKPASGKPLPTNSAGPPAPEEIVLDLPDDAQLVLDEKT